MMAENCTNESLYCIPPEFVNRAYYYNRENQRYESVLEEDVVVDMRKNPFHVTMGKYNMNEKEWKLFDQLTSARTSFFKTYKKQYRKLLYPICTFVIIENDDEILTRYGDPADSFFVVLQGRLDCVINDNQGAAGSASDILTTVKAKKKKQFNSERAMNSSKKKCKIVPGQRLLLENGKRMRHREAEINGLIVGTFAAGDSFGETALLGTNKFTRRASIMSCKGTSRHPCVLIRIAAKDYEGVRNEIERFQRDEMVHFLHKTEFLSHWSRERIGTLVNGAQLCTFSKNSVVERPSHAVTLWIVKSGTVRRLKRVKISGKSTIMEIQNASRGEVLGAAEMFHSISFCSGFLVTSKTNPTELIKLSIVAFQMITADEIACQKLKALVNYDGFLDFFRIKEYYEDSILDGKKHLRRVAIPKESTIMKEKAKNDIWGNFCDNIFLSIPSPLSNVEIHDRVQENKYYQDALKYLNKTIDKKTTSASKEGLRIFAANLRDKKINKERREMFETVARGTLQEKLKNARHVASQTRKKEIDMYSEISDNGISSDEERMAEWTRMDEVHSKIVMAPPAKPDLIGVSQDSPRNKRLMKKNLPFRELKKGYYTVLKS